MHDSRPGLLSFWKDMESERTLISDMVLSRQDLFQEKERVRKEHAKLPFEEKAKILVNSQKLTHHWGGEKISSYGRSHDCWAVLNFGGNEKIYGSGDNSMDRGAGFGKLLPLFRCTAEQREEILAALKGVLAAQPEVVFAYAYGSLLEDRPFHDIDVGIYVAVDTVTALGAAVKRLFRRGLRSGSDRNHPYFRFPPVDVRVLNWAPASFCYHVLQGRPLFSRDDEARTRWAERVIARYLDVKPLRYRALKEAMFSWG